jgi:hypothetical protein
MSINRNNYEAYFLDYRENNLNPEQVAELLIFLEENPDLKEEFESFEDIVLAPDPNIILSKKESLKKNEFIPTDNISQRNYNDFMIADLEGDLNEDESLELKAFISLNPKTKLEYNFYRSTFLKPDKSIQFFRKDKLKKTGLFVVYKTQAVYALAVAASIIILLGVYFNFPDQPAKREFTNTINKLTPKSVYTGASVFNADNETQPMQQIEYRFTKAPEPLTAGKFESREKNNLPEISHLKSMQIASVSMVGKPEHQNMELQLRINESSLMAITESATTTETQPQKSFVSRFVSGLAGKVIKTDNLKGKSFLDFTIEGYNLMADKNVTLEKEVDETGRVIAYSVDGQNLSFFRNKSQQKE